MMNKRIVDKTWRPVGDSKVRPTHVTTGGVIDMCDATIMTVVVALTGKIYTSDDYGKTWAETERE